MDMELTAKTILVRELVLKFGMDQVRIWFSGEWTGFIRNEEISQALHDIGHDLKITPKDLQQITVLFTALDTVYQSMAHIADDALRLQEAIEEWPDYLNRQYRVELAKLGSLIS